MVVRQCHEVLKSQERSAIARLNGVESKLQSEIQKLETELSAYKSEKPEADLEIQTIIRRQTKSMNIFVEVALTLERPSQLQVTEYVFELMSRQGTTKTAEIVNDLVQWERASQATMLGLSCLPKEFRRRGQRVTGWLHFQLEASAPEIEQGRYNFRVITPHGEISANDWVSHRLAYEKIQQKS